MPSYFCDYYPKVERHDFISAFCLQIRPQDFREPIGISQAWQCRLKDARRKCNPLYEGLGGQLTAVSFSAMMISDGSRVASEMQYMPFLQPIEDCREEDLPEEAEAEEDREVREEAAAVFGAVEFDGNAHIE